MSDNTTPRSWVGCLGCYNEGYLIGDWFEATDAPTEVAEFNKRVRLGRAEDSHRFYGHDELWVLDHENFLGLLEGEFSPAEGARVAAVIEKLGDDAPAYGVYRSHGHGGGDLGDPDDVQRFRDSYRGIWTSERAYAEEHLASIGDLDLIPERLRCYFDYDRYTHEMFMGDYSSYHAPQNEVYVFDVTV